MLFDSRPLELNRSPRMAELYVRLLDGIAPYYDVVNMYSLTSDYSENNAFGLKEYSGQKDAVKYNAVVSWIRRSH